MAVGWLLQRQLSLIGDWALSGRCLLFGDVQLAIIQG